MNRRKRVLITGATSGLGKSIAMKLLAEPDRFIVQGVGRAPDALFDLQNEGAAVFPADVTDINQMDAVLEQTGIPDIVILSAGMGRFTPVHEMEDDEIRQTMDVNVISQMLLINRLLPSMIARGSGHLIFIGSQAGKVATPKSAVYAATKHALIGYVNALRMETAELGIHVTIIHPGPIDTPFLDHADETGSYRKSLGRHLLTVDTVSDACIKVIDKPVREVDLPKYMGISSKLYQLAPGLVEKVGKKYFTKK